MSELLLEYSKIIHELSCVLVGQARTLDVAYFRVSRVLAPFLSLESMYFTFAPLYYNLSSM